MTPASARAPKYGDPCSSNVSNFIFISLYAVRLGLMWEGCLPPVVSSVKGANINLRLHANGHSSYPY
jgi:hypothetical protein